MALILVGVILLVVSYISGLTTNRAVLLGAVSCVIAGVFLHVRVLKKGSKY